MDGKHNIAVNVRITPANVNDAEPAAEILKDIEKRWGTILSTWGWTRDTTARRCAAGLRQPGYGRQQAAGGIRTRGTISGNTVSPMIQSKTSIYVRKGMS